MKFGRHRIRKLAAALTASLLCGMLLSGCSAGNPRDIDTLLRAPQLSGQTSAVQRALNSYLGESSTLKYPASGDFLSPFLFGDWDGDGTDEAAVLYTTDKVGPNVWLAVLEKDSEETWKVICTAEGLSGAVERVTYAPLRDDGSQQLLVGYATAQGDNYMTVYLYNEGQLSPVIRQAYTDMLLADVTGKGGTQDLVLALPTESENGGLNLQLLTNFEGMFRSNQTLGIGAGSFNGCASLQASVSRTGEPIVVVDGYTGGSSTYLATLAVKYDEETGYLTSSTMPTSRDLPSETLRYDPNLLSTDIDGNGTVDIPTLLEDGGELESPMDKRLSFVLWKDYSTASGGVTTFGVYDSEYGFFVPLPESMHGNVKLRANTAGTGWLVCSREDNTSYCELRVVDRTLGETTNYKQIAVQGSQQLQVRIITAYYGLDLTRLLNRTVIFGGGRF